MIRRACSCSLAVAVLLSVATSGFLVASPVGKKAPSAKAQLAKAYKNLLKTKTYAVDTNVLGGLSNTEDHRVVTTTVNETYGGSIFGASREPIMHIPSIKAFKMPKAGKGVISSSGNWVRILSTPTGVKMDRLVDFPTLILGEAMKYRNSARWLDEKEIADFFESEDVLEFEDLDADDADDSEEAGEVSRGKTIVKSSEKESAEKTPRVLRVTADPKQALTIWIERVENSGCMKEG